MNLFCILHRRPISANQRKHSHAACQSNAGIHDMCLAASLSVDAQANGYLSLSSNRRTMKLSALVNSSNWQKYTAQCKLQSRACFDGQDSTSCQGCYSRTPCSEGLEFLVPQIHLVNADLFTCKTPVLLQLYPVHVWSNAISVCS